MKRIKWCAGIITAIFLSGYSSYGALPVVPETVMPPAMIDEIMRTENFFLYRQMDSETPIWKHTDRLYSSHFLGARTHYIDLDEMLHRLVTGGNTIIQRLETLYRAKMAIHVNVGDVVPKLNLQFGAGAIVDSGRVFAGLFNFLLPSNWLKLASSGHVYQSAKYLLARTVMDEILRAKLAYYAQHQRIQEFEIINYYFLHLQLLGRMYPKENRAISTLLGNFGVQGTDMASKRGDTKLGFDDIALTISMEKSGEDFTSDDLNIQNIDDFPTVVKDLADLEVEYRDKELFLEKVVQRSVELKAVRELYKASKFDVGVSASGNMFGYVDRPLNVNNDARFAFTFGYGTLPQILISKSYERSAKIDVRREYIAMLDNARRSFDYYTNALGAYTEAKRSLALNRKAFKQNLDYLIKTKADPDSLFLLSINQLVSAELKLNNALHASLIARAYMDRYLLVDHERAMANLPQKEHVIKHFNELLSKHSAAMDRDQEVDQVFATVRKAEELDALLNQHEQHPVLRMVNREEFKAAVRRNLSNLLYSHMRFYKGKGFYEVLKKYVVDHQLETTAREKFTLDHKIDSFLERVFARTSHVSGSFLHSMKFEDFTNKDFPHH